MVQQSNFLSLKPIGVQCSLFAFVLLGSSNYKTCTGIWPVYLFLSPFLPFLFYAIIAKNISNTVVCSCFVVLPLLTQMPFLVPTLTPGPASELNSMLIRNLALMEGRYLTASIIQFPRQTHCSSLSYVSTSSRLTVIEMRLLQWESMSFLLEIQVFSKKEK